MARRQWLIVAIIALASGCAPKSKPSSPEMRQLMIVSVDGLRSDLALRANAPNIRSLYQRGAFTFWARSTEVSVTLPTHTSMLTGVVPARHDVWWNYDMSEYYLRYPAVPTLFELAKQAGCTTALVAGKSKFKALTKPGTVDWVYLPDGSADDAQVAQEAVTLIEQHQPQVLFVHFPRVDATGHESGWGSDTQVRAIENADLALGTLLTTLRRKRLLDSTVIILTADHGGAGKSHGAGDPRSRHIPWIIAGPGIKQNVDLTTDRHLVVNVEDTFATACYLLKLPLDEDLDGKPILQVLVDPPAPDAPERLKDLPDSRYTSLEAKTPSR